MIKNVIWLPIALSLISCSSAKSKISNSCMKSGMPENVCSCTYDTLSHKYSDGQIETLFDEMEKLDAGIKKIPSRELKPFAMDMTDAFSRCAGVR